MLCVELLAPLAVRLERNRSEHLRLETAHLAAELTADRIAEHFDLPQREDRSHAR